MKKPLLWVIAAFLFGAGCGLFVAFHFFGGVDPAYWVARAKYNADVKNQMGQVNAAIIAIAERDKVITSKESLIATAESQVKIYKAKAAEQAQDGKDLAAENARLKRDVPAAIAANPAVKALIDNFELRCANYDSQILTLNQTVSKRDSQIEDFGVEVIALKYQRNTYEKMFGDEHQLRLSGDSLRLGLEKRLNTNKFWSWIGKGALVAGGGLAIYLATRKK